MTRLFTLKMDLSIYTVLQSCIFAMAIIILSNNFVVRFNYDNPSPYELEESSLEQSEADTEKSDFNDFVYNFVQGYELVKICSFGSIVKDQYQLYSHYIDVFTPPPELSII